MAGHALAGVMEEFLKVALFMEERSAMAEDNNFIKELLKTLYHRTAAYQGRAGRPLTVLVVVLL